MFGWTFCLFTNNKNKIKNNFSFNINHELLLRNKNINKIYRSTYSVTLLDVTPYDVMYTLYIYRSEKIAWPISDSNNMPYEHNLLLKYKLLSSSNLCKIKQLSRIISILFNDLKS